MNAYNIIGKKGSDKIIEIYSAFEITDKEMLKRFEGRLGNESEVRFYIDQSLKGGFFVKDIANNKIFDGSVKGMLEKLKLRIIKI